ncbi:phosphotransferase [Bifidobacterium santillanense]|uniref:phosphotransferase n=1 Tax=Bifidobacterium santillanense TaxID=2809028 RepID=UPI001F0AB0CA|nr:phosphotransferase [Bifidobacterium santillanense]
MLAALTSAALPSVIVAGVFPGATHIGGIDQAQVRDVTGKTYDVYATDDEKGRRRLAARVKAAKALAEAREPGGLGFAVDRVLAFVPGDDPKGPTGRTAVMVAMHQDGRERDLNLLTLDDCSSMGTAIGAIHRLNPMFLAKAKYPMFATAQIKAQLVAWIARLKRAGHVPPEITSSWSKILETEGLWSFGTCLVHGGFEDGDVRFSGSTITAINNWQNMQVNDPARDLAWIFSKLDEDHRNAVLTAYGRMMGNRLDDLIMLRANLWVQMEQVGEFIQALNKADTQGIIRFKAQVDRLAHQLGVTSRAVDDSNAAAKARRSAAAGADDPDDTADNPPSTITVGTLLKDGERRRAAAKAAQEAARAAQEPDDETAESDRTGSSDIEAAGRIAVPTGNDDTMDAPIKAPEVTLPPSFHVGGAPADAGSGAPTRTGATGATTKPQPAGGYASMPAPSSSETITLDSIDDDDDTDEHDVEGPSGDGAAKDSPAPVSQETPATDDHDEAPSAPSFPVAAAVAHGGFGTDRLMDPGVPPSAFSSPRGGHPNNAATIVIPLLEREERALRDARAGLDSSNGTRDTEPVVMPQAEPEEPRNFDEKPEPAATGADAGDGRAADADAEEPDDTADTPVASASGLFPAAGPDVTDEPDDADDTADTPVADATGSPDPETDGDEDDDTGESVTTPKA